MWIYKILIYGGVILKKAMIYVHGKGGSYLEAEQFKNICLDFDVFGVDYNDYFPWIVKNKIMEVYDKISEKYDYIYVLANSIGAYFTMHTLQNFKIEKALFISPILDMEQLPPVPWSFRRIFPFPESQSRLPFHSSCVSSVLLPEGTYPDSVMLPAASVRSLAA